jgi:hypothetical protein
MPTGIVTPLFGDGSSAGEGTGSGRGSSDGESTGAAPRTWRREPPGSRRLGHRQSREATDPVPRRHWPSQPRPRREGRRSPEQTPTMTPTVGRTTLGRRPRRPQLARTSRCLAVPGPPVAPPIRGRLRPPVAPETTRREAWTATRSARLMPSARHRRTLRPRRGFECGGRGVSPGCRLPCHNCKGPHEAVGGTAVGPFLRGENGAKIDNSWAHLYDFGLPFCRSEREGKACARLCRRGRRLTESGT